MRHWENGVSQSFLSDQCDSCISPENEGFDVRWVRFPKHIPLFSALSELGSVDSGDFSDLVQRMVRETQEFRLTTYLPSNESTAAQ